MPVDTIIWGGDCLTIIDQTLLPEELVYRRLKNVDEVAEAICSLRVRGAPAIGIAGAMGIALEAVRYKGSSLAEMRACLKEAAHVLAATRPTAVNLFWGLERMKRRMTQPDCGSIEALKKVLPAEAEAILAEDRHVCRALGRHGAELLPPDCAVLTHCNAGGLATGDYGTALGVIYAAAETGRNIRVFADETRPLLQGSRLTAWELQQSGIDVTVLCDSAAGSLLAAGKIDAVIVGADRIAANGDTANKIGTYPLSVMAREHSVPFYVAAPVSTIDYDIPSGQHIPIESRSGEEIGSGFGRRTAPEGVGYYNPAFDVTPAANITAIITEKGVVRDPFTAGLAAQRQTDRLP